MEDRLYIVSIVRASLNNQLRTMKEEEAPSGKGMAEYTHYCQNGADQLSHKVWKWLQEKETCVDGLSYRVA
jgi:hypothetical protein